jgi:hypothetical protein
MSKRIAVVSAFQNKEENVKRLNLYLKFVFDKGMSPFASHGLYPGVLDDADPVQRKQGMEAGKEFIRICDEVWVFVVDGIITSGMEDEVRFAMANNIPIKWFCADDPKKVVDLMHVGEYDYPTKKQLMPATDKNSQKVRTGFDSIASSLKKGKSYSTYDEEIDKLLGTEMEDRDLEAEEIYERGHREKEE